MKIYLVGGAVRDELLGLSPKERDWVVVGATVEDMLKLDYRQVGKDFPVFLHPETKEEYALARKERKVGRGYTGFTFDASSQVTLEEDLMRRDLTINAMAKTAEGKLIDPYHGKMDLEKKLLRHVSPAFSEDPVRILRIARFAARFGDFSVADETNELMKQMVLSGEVDALVAERVWKELERALNEKNPERFFQVLANCNALPVLFPGISADGPEIDALKRAAEKYSDPQIRFAALMHKMPEKDLNELCERYRVPNEYKELALLLVKNADILVFGKSDDFSVFQGDSTLHNKDITEPLAFLVLKIFLCTDAFRREERFKKLLNALEVSYPNDSLSWIEDCYNASKMVDVKKIMAAGVTGKEISEKLNKERQKVIREKMREHSSRRDRR